jgi:hypothetical protein
MSRQQITEKLEELKKTFADYKLIITDPEVYKLFSFLFEPLNNVKYVNIRCIFGFFLIIYAIQ